MFLYESGTNQLKYTLVHTLNRLGNPDTLYLDPNLTYDLVVNTLPVTIKKNIQLKTHVHNTIDVPSPQGLVKITSPKSSFSPQFTVRVSDKNGKTLHHQMYDQTCKYIVGKYDVEIFTIPRIYRSIEVGQSMVCSVDIEAPGQLEYSFTKPMVAQLFQQNKTGFWACIHTFSDILTKDKLLVQPGTYKMVYRPKDMKSSGYTNEKTLTINANKTTSITLN
jgi:Ca-activated chloride channel family protein